MTGAGANIGAATARALAQRGARLALVDRDADRALAIAKELGNGAAPLTADVTRPEELEAAAQAALDRFGGFDGLVNNAGYGYVTPILETPPPDFAYTLAINLTAPYLLSRRIAPHMPNGSAIVNLISIYGVVAAPDRAGYCASKAGLAMLTRVQAIEWASRGIRVNGIAPGYIETDEVAALVRDGKVALDAIQRRTPMGRLGTPAEIAEGVAFLLDGRAASYLTGHILGVDGGWAAYGYV
ncbi:MAG: SDR family oxidoreductase [Alphaproteobacteria bacterium]|nr:SDR family oxidoreductase [Alphaproteobacteria bacterium]